MSEQILPVAREGKKKKKKKKINIRRIDFLVDTELTRARFFFETAVPNWLKQR